MQCSYLGGFASLKVYVLKENEKPADRNQQVCVDFTTVFFAENSLALSTGTVQGVDVLSLLSCLAIDLGYAFALPLISLILPFFLVAGWFSEY